MKGHTMNRTYLTLAAAAPAKPKTADAPEGTEAAESAPVRLALQSPLTLDTEARTITGLVLPYGVLAQRTSMGAIRFSAGSLKHHPDLKRIKLLLDHDPAQAVGYATAVDQTGEGVVVSFHLPAGPEGDDALAKAANGIRDGLSIGADLTMHAKSADGRVTEVTEATLNEVSLVSLPAFSDSRVHTVRASQTAPAGAPVTVNVQLTEPAPVALAPAPYATAATVATMDQLTDTIAATLKAGGRASQVMAALADIVPADDAGHAHIGAPSLLGELWTADNADTPLTDALAKGDLTAIKVQGWRWNVRPQVAPYTGNKTEIPTGPISTVPAEALAERMAGGWDIDRIYMDLGDGGFIRSVFEAATADYKRKVEAKIAADLAAAATVVEASTSLPAALGKLGTVAGQLGSRLSFIALAPDVWGEFVNLGEGEVPWWIRNQGTIDLGTTSGTAGGLRFSVNHGLTAGQILAGDSRAAKLHRPSTNPIQVQALDIANGGVDLGVYGYHALMVHDARAILRTTITAGV